MPDPPPFPKALGTQNFTYFQNITLASVRERLGVHPNLGSKICTTRKWQENAAEIFPERVKGAGSKSLADTSVSIKGFNPHCGPPESPTLIDSSWEYLILSLLDQIIVLNHLLLTWRQPIRFHQTTWGLTFGSIFFACLLLFFKAFT